MNKRTVEEIFFLNRIDQEITIKQMADRFEVSTRTIRNDLKEINELLESNGLSETSMKSGGRIVREKDFPNLLPLVSENEDFYSYKLSREERIRIASVILVNGSGYTTLSMIADSLFVSRATVINDLEQIKKSISDNGLQVLSHPNKGLMVEGAESRKREFLLSYSKSGTLQDEIAVNQISVQAGNRIIIQKIVNEQEKIHNSHLTDYFFQRLMDYLGIMVNRNMQGEYIELQTEKNDRKYTMAQGILRYIAQYCGVNTTEDEIRYLSLILGRSHYMKEESRNSDIIRIQALTRSFIDNISDEIGIRLSGDYDFFESLSNHIQSVFTPEAPDYPDNPSVNEILEEHADILDAVKKCLPVISQHVHREITEAEIGYITVHVCAALERKKNKEIAFHVIVACHAGIGTSHLLLAKLKKHFNFQIVDIISSHEAAYLEEGRADFVISTVALNNCKLDHIVVSPLLNDEDYIRVGNKIDTLRNSRNLPPRIEDDSLSAKGLIEKLNPIVYEMIPDEAEALMKRMRRVIREYFNQSVEIDSEIFAPSLHHLLPASHIQLDVECTDWKDAIRNSSQLLVEKGYIEEHYIDSMIDNVIENGPYFVLSPGFAVPHEGIDKGSIKVGMNLIRLAKPVAFGVEEFDPVEFVCVLSAIDKKTHLKAFFNLVNMLQTPDFKRKLHECKNSDEAAKVIEQFEYSVQAV